MLEREGAVIFRQRTVQADEVMIQAVLETLGGLVNHTIFTGLEVREEMSHFLLLYNTPLIMVCVSETPPALTRRKPDQDEIKYDHRLIDYKMTSPGFTVTINIHSQTISCNIFHRRHRSIIRRIKKIHREQWRLSTVVMQIPPL